MASMAARARLSSCVFGGLSFEEMAKVLTVSPGTVMRDWTFPRAWLLNLLWPCYPWDGRLPHLVF